MHKIKSMKQLKLFLLLSIIIFPASGQKSYTWKQASSGGYTYKYVTNDPMKARFYLLKNGMTVMLSANHKDPRIAVRFAVRAGSNNDPENHTGLAHYLEHLLFKGTQQYGSLDWQMEKNMLHKIDELYEVYNHVTDSTRRKLIYHEIDSISGVASKYSIANEYMNLMGGIGSQGTNAHTSVEETVYKEDIPSGSVDKFLAVQSERFRDPVFRLFHTELEAVYEEKNRGLDNDGVKMQEAMMRYLFPTHHYGQQTTIGTVEHLKNPSIVAIRDFYNRYYVPNNMAVVMSGDFDPDAMISKIDKAFAYMRPKPVQAYHTAAEKLLGAPVVKDIYGPSAENMRICFRTPAAGTRYALVLDLISSILANGKAGLLDLDLNKQQKLQSADAGLWQFKDYGVFLFLGTPKQEQSLEEVRDLLFEEMEKLKKGDFDESLVRAIALNSKLAELQGLDKNENRVGSLVNEFIKSKAINWNRNVAYLDEQAKVTKKEIVDVANRYIGNGYVLLNKRKGEDKDIVKVEKPQITPVQTNAGKKSAFVKKIENMPLNNTRPEWLDYDKAITRSKAGIADILYVQNKDNDLFRLNFRFEMGVWNNKLLPLAAQYLQFLGTGKYSSEEINKAFYAIAGSFNINAGNEITTITVSGLGENFDQSLSLFEELISGCKPDETALNSLKDRLMKERANAKLDKRTIMRGLISYARYGEKNPFNSGLSDEEIANLKAEDLVNILHTLFQYTHTIIYYGPKAINELASTISRQHQLPAAFTAYPEKTTFVFSDQPANQVLFTDYDMVQSEIYWVRNEGLYDTSKETVVDVFNNYFGGGMGSVVFQTIRESKALAYSTFAQYVTPQKKEDPFYTIAYVGCQADKMNEAITGMNELMNTLPLSQNNFELARSGIKKDISTERITEDGIIFSWLAGKQKGMDYDYRRTEYETLDKITLDDIKQFHAGQLSGKNYAYCILASEKKVSMDDLKKIGEVKILSLEEIFGY